MEIKLLRHGESKANTGEVNPEEIGDCNVPLTSKGKRQAFEVGRDLGADYLRSALVYYSPYLRTRMTLAYLLQGAGLEPGDIKTYEDPRLREIERGYVDSISQKPLREIHNWFFYRFQYGGESPADGYDRASAIILSIQRQIQRTQKENVLVVGHGTQNICLVVRYLHLRVPQFCNIDTPDNCGIMTIAPQSDMPDADYRTGFWAVKGLKFRDDDVRQREIEEETVNPLVWDTDSPEEWADL